MVPHVEKRARQIWINSGSWDGEMVLDHLGGPSVIPGSLGARAWCQGGSSRLLPQQWAIEEVVSSQEAASWPFGTFMKTRNERLLTSLDHQQLVLFILTYVASYFFSEAIMLSDFGNGLATLWVEWPGPGACHLFLPVPILPFSVYFTYLNSYISPTDFKEVVLVQWEEHAWLL